MRRFLCFAIAAMLMLSLAACTEEPVKPTTEPDTTAAITESAVSTAAPTEEETIGSHEVLSLTFINTFDQNPSIEEQSIYEKDGVSVKATAIRYDTVHGPQIVFSVKNDTENDLLIQNRYTTVNGFMMKPEINAKIPKKKTTECEMSLPYIDLAMADIHSLNTVEFSLRLLDSKTYQELDVTDIVKLKLQNTSGPQAAYDVSGQTAYDKDGVKVVLQGIKKDTLFESSCVLMVYMENHTGRTVCIKNKKLTVNGYDITTSMTSTILPDQRAVDKIELYDQDLEEYGITTIDSVKVSFEIYDYEDWKLIADSKDVSAEIPTEPATEAPTEIATEETK